ncbi:MAG: YdcF family protein [Elusimicrobia bacterium]|nr:YdcF family protein [Elusimicrobiota bacterium]
MRRLVVLFLLWGVPALAADRYDALIVLGGGGPPEGWANPVLVERVCKAVRERAAGRAERLVMTGGYTTGHIAEAEMMRAVAVAMGVPAKDVLIEPSSVSTAENAAFMLRLARTANIHKAALVSHRSHFPRARETFERAGGGWWTDLGVIEADGALSSPCFPRVEPLALGSTVDMLITDVTEDESVDELINRPADVPTRRLVEEVLAAGQAYEAGLARRLYFVEPTASTPTVIGSRGFARGHISRTELARVLATAYGVAFDSTA